MPVQHRHGTPTLLHLLPRSRPGSRAGGLAAALLVAAAILLTLCGGSAQAAPDPDGGFGLNVQSLLRNGGRLSRDDVARLLDAMAADGLRTGRSDALWSYLEPGSPQNAQHRYAWADADATAAALARAGIRWQPVLHGSPSWASSDPSSLFAAPTPGHFGDFATFAGAFASRYGAGGTFWDAHPELPRLPVGAIEIFNEENTAVHWGATPDPVAYADLFAQAQGAIKAASGGTGVLVGGIVWNDDAAYLGAVLDRLGPGTPLDGVAIHPYAPTVSSLLPNVQRMRRVLDAAGRTDVPLSLNELGWPAAYDRAPASFALQGPVTDTARAATLALTVDALSRSTCAISGIDVYDAIEAEDDPGHVESLMGIYRHDGSSTQTGAAYWDAVRRFRAEAAAPRPAPPVPVCGSAGAPRTRLLALSLMARPLPGGCHQATVTYRGLPLEEAQVRVLKPYPGVVSTDAEGQATICPPRPGGNAGLRIAAEVPGAAASNQEICDLRGGTCRALGAAAACALRAVTFRAGALQAVLRGRGLVARTAGCNPTVGGVFALRTTIVLPRRAARRHGFAATRRDVSIGRGRGVIVPPDGTVAVPARLTPAGRRALRRNRRLPVLVQVTASEDGTRDTILKRVTLRGRAPRKTARRHHARPRPAPRR